MALFLRSYACYCLSVYMPSSVILTDFGSVYVMGFGHVRGDISVYLNVLPDLWPQYFTGGDGLAVFERLCKMIYRSKYDHAVVFEVCRSGRAIQPNSTHMSLFHRGFPTRYTPETSTTVISGIYYARGLPEETTDFSPPTFQDCRGKSSASAVIAALRPHGEKLLKSEMQSV